MRWLVALLMVVSGLAFARSLIKDVPRVDRAGELHFSFDVALRRHVRSQFDEGNYNRLIEEALEAGDFPLAKSYADLANDFDYAVYDKVQDKLNLASGKQEGISIKSAAWACFTGTTGNVSELLGTLACDLLVIGDIRDILIEGNKIANDDEPDKLILGLSLFGLASSVATFQSGGALAGVDLGASLVKTAKRTKKITPEFEKKVVRSC